LFYQLWTHPRAVRRLVMDKLGVRFIHVNVGLESARLRLLGGIAISDLRMARSDGLDHADFLYVPTAVIYHDKEQIMDGKLSIRKVELNRPQLRLVREHDGTFNLKGILGPVDLSERMPTVVIKNGTVVVEDKAGNAPGQVLEIHEVNLTILNDPLPILELEGSGQTDVAGPIKFKASVPRASMAAQIEIELPTVPIGPALIQRLDSYCSETASHLRQLTGTGAMEAHLAYYPDTNPPLHYEIGAHLRNGELNHVRLPGRLTGLDAEVHVSNGLVPKASFSAQCGSAHIEASVKDLACSTLMRETNSTEAPSLYECVQEMELKVDHLHIDAAVLGRLPENLDWIQKDYTPVGTVSLTHSFRRGAGPTPVTRRWVIRPEGGRASCVYFPYPVTNVQGIIDVDVSRTPERNITLDLKGRAGPCPVTVTGNVIGPKATSEVQIDVRGQGLVLDEPVLKALASVTGDPSKIAEQFLPDRCRNGGIRHTSMGKADFHAAVHRPCGQTKMQNIFTVAFKEAAVKYDQFPYPLENVTGVLVLYPDHWECKSFHGVHAGGDISVDGRSYPSPNTSQDTDAPTRQSVHLVIQGKSVPLDSAFAKALAPPGVTDRNALANAWETLGLHGRMGFQAIVVDHPGRPQDLDVDVEIQGCSLKPTFFPFALSDLKAKVHSTAGLVHLKDIEAKHGKAILGLPWGLIQLNPGGGFDAWLKPIQGKNLAPDEDFLAALPEPLRKGLAPLKLQGPVDVKTQLIMKNAGRAGQPFMVWWDGEAVLQNNRFRAGVETSNVDGRISCRGFHDGTRMKAVAGDMLLTRAVILNQPLSNVHGRLEILADSPDVMRFRDLKADFFGGTLGGEARIQINPEVTYEVLLEGVGVQLNQFGRHNLGPEDAQAQLEGPARASVFLSGKGNDLLGLQGHGQMDVPSGKMGKLPFLLDLLKAFGLRLPDRTAFEQAKATFAIEGPRIKVEQLDLYGNAISLSGQGTVDLDGTNLNLDFTATPGRVRQVLPGALEIIPQSISEQLLKIKARGKLGKGGVKFEKEFVPNVMEPLKKVFNGG
jgi:hypothetical protein